MGEMGCSITLYLLAASRSNLLLVLMTGSFFVAASSQARGYMSTRCAMLSCSSRIAKSMTALQTCVWLRRSWTYATLAHPPFGRLDARYLS